MPKKNLPQSVFDEILDEISAMGPVGHELEDDEITIRGFMKRYPDLKLGENVARGRLETAVRKGLMTRSKAVVGGKNCVIYKLVKGAKPLARRSDS